LISNIFKEAVGKGPKRIKSRIFEDIAVVRVERYPMPLLDHLLSFDKGREVLKTMSRKLFKLFKDEIKLELSSLIGIEVKDTYLDTEKVEGEFVLTVIFSDLII
jgi:uncharacterized protein YbcI